MTNGTDAALKRKVPEVITFRPGALTPLIQKWLERNPDLDQTALVKRGLRKELKPLAGKRLAHLVDERAA